MLVIDVNKNYFCKHKHVTSKSSWNYVEKRAKKGREKERKEELTTCIKNE